jgi:hypothetical protein
MHKYFNKIFISLIALLAAFAAILYLVFQHQTEGGTAANKVDPLTFINKTTNTIPLIEVVHTYKDANGNIGCNFLMGLPVSDTEFSDLAAGETINYLVATEEQRCVSIETDFGDYEIGPISGAHCGITLAMENENSPQTITLSKGCVCTGTGPGACPSTQSPPDDPAGYSMTIKNMNHDKFGFILYATTAKNVSPDDYSVPGSCWKHEGERLFIVGEEAHYPAGFLYGNEVAIGSANAPDRYICLGAVAGVNKFLLNPVIDTPECYLEFYRIEGGKNEGEARATPQCAYYGRCPDGEFYDKSRESCCPEGFWDSETKKCN